MKYNDRIREYSKGIYTAGKIVAITIIIGFIVAWSFSAYGEEQVYTKIKTIEPAEVNGQYCFVKITIKEVNDEVIKEEILECADGKKGIDTPGYWELFAQYYYRDVNTPDYCRYYSRSNHAFKSFGKVCLMINGEWEVQ
jgi:hypothetical protein